MDTSSKLYSTNTSKPMGEAVGTITGTSFSSSSHRRSREMENLSLEISKYPRDLLQRFLGTTNPSASSSATTIARTRAVTLDDFRLGCGGGDVDEDDGGLNLGLGLSLGGKFGVDKTHKGLIRSSSIVGTMPLSREDDKVAPPPPAAMHTLVRTSSLPVETEEEWRKRKEMQTLRRMEAKRRRSEKQRILRESGVSGGGEDKGAENLNFRGRLEREQQCLGISSKVPGGGDSGSSVGGNPCGSSALPPNVEVKRRTTFGSLQGFLMAEAQAQSQSQAQGSGESQGGSSSGASELDSRTHHVLSLGASSCGEAARSPASIHSLQERGSQDSGSKGESTQAACAPETDSSSKPPDADVNTKKRETGTGRIEDMPCVFTIGDGPYGRKVEGILYRYGKGEDVRIMCVCHGSFFSPGEFVKHAGGIDVEHPLRHIVVSPSASPFQ